MKKKRKGGDPFFNVQKVGSATECTGLMPALPQTEEEDKNSAALYAIHDEEKEE